MRLPVLFALAVLATGCVAGGFDPAGGDDGGDDGGDQPGPAGEAEAQYRANVHPVMVAKCSTAGCHAQQNATGGYVAGVYGFAIPDQAASYQQIMSVPTLVGTYTAESASLITKMKQPGGHNAVVYSSNEELAITNWLAAELAEREEDGPIIDPNEVLRTWSGCMSLENFEASEPPMAEAWGQLGSNDTNQRCANCHQAGLYTFLTGDGNNAEQFFTGLTTQKDFLLKYFTVDATGTVIINNGSMTNAGVTLAAHPRFNPTVNNGMTALKSFYDLTLARQAANLCDPARLPL